MKNLKTTGKKTNWWKLLKEPSAQLVSQEMLSDALWFVLVMTMRQNEMKYRHLGTIADETRRINKETQLYCKAELIRDFAENLRREGVTLKNEQSSLVIQQLLDAIEQRRV